MVPIKQYLLLPFKSPLFIFIHSLQSRKHHNILITREILETLLFGTGSANPFKKNGGTDMKELIEIMHQNIKPLLFCSLCVAQFLLLTTLLLGKI